MRNRDKSRQSESVALKTNLTEQTIKRSHAAQELGGLSARTMRRYEIVGLLNPIKRNARSTFYFVSEVEKIKLGDFPTT